MSAASGRLIRQHWPGLVPPSIHAEAVAALAATAWFPDPQTGSNFYFETSEVEVPSLSAWVNGPLAEALGLARFELSWKRLAAHPEHRFPWHRDHRHGGEVGVVVNLSAGPVEGGVFEERVRGEDQPSLRIHSQPRDVHLFEVSDPRRVHRVTPVTGDVARVVWAGWAQRR